MSSVTERDNSFRVRDEFSGRYERTQKRETISFREFLNQCSREQKYPVSSPKSCSSTWKSQRTKEMEILTSSGTHAPARYIQVGGVRQGAVGPAPRHSMDHLISFTLHEIYSTKKQNNANNSVYKRPSSKCRFEVLTAVVMNPVSPLI
jgi:hypothetical protein